MFTVPTNTGVVLEKYVYKTPDNKKVFQEALYTLLRGSVADAFTAFTYIDFIIGYFEEENVAAFKIDIDEILNLVKDAIYIHREEFKEPIRFTNGKVNKNPMGFMEFFSNEVLQKYGVNILE